MARNDQTCIINLRIGGEHGFDAEEALLVPLIEDLEAAVEEAECGEFDGEEFDGTWHQLIFVGPEADELQEILEAILSQSPLSKNAKLTKRYGAVDDPEAEEVELEY